MYELKKVGKGPPQQHKHTHYNYKEASHKVLKGLKCAKSNFWSVLQWNPSTVATIGERNFVLYRGVALSQRLIYTKRAHLGLCEVACIEGCPHIRGGLYRGCPHIRSGLYRGVSSHQGWPV